MTHKFFLLASWSSWPSTTMLWHALLLVARLQHVKNGAGLQDDRKLPPPQNVALVGLLPRTPPKSSFTRGGSEYMASHLSEGFFPKAARRAHEVRSLHHPPPFRKMT